MKKKADKKIFDDNRSTYARIQTLTVSFYRDVASKVQYWLPVILIAVLSYGFSVFNRTVSIDDLSRDYYNGSGHAMIRATRWGMDFWAKLFSTSKAYTPFVDKFFGVIFFLFAAFLLSLLLFSLNGKSKHIWQYTVFSCSLISFPLINEIWEYNGANMITCGNLVLVAIALLIQTQQDEATWKSMLTASMIMSPVMSGYESGIFTYITLVFIIFYLKYCVYCKKKCKFLVWFKEGVEYALPLFVALLLRFAIGKALIAIYGLTYAPNGATDILWWPGNISSIISGTVADLYVHYFIYGFVYLPITIFVCCILFFAIYSIVMSVKKKQILPIILGFALGLSLFLQSFIQGLNLPYRTAQTIQIFVPFVCYLLVTMPPLQAADKKRIRSAVIVLLMLVSLRQGVYLHTILALNNQRSDNEAAIVQQLGFRLYSEYDYCNSRKLVVFVGGIDLGDDIMSQVTATNDSFEIGAANSARALAKKEAIDRPPFKYIATNVNSVMTWNCTAFSGQKLMRLYFSYYGFDIETLDGFSGNDYYKYLRLAEENNMSVYELRDMGDYILIYLG